MRATLAIFILTAVVISGCARDSKKTPYRGAGPEVTGEFQQDTTSRISRVSNPPKPENLAAELEWSPDKVKVECAEKFCPLQVGVLIFADKLTDGKFPLRVCTAFLVDADVIASNGHCDASNSQKGYFIGQDVRGVRIVRGIERIVFKQYTANRDPDPKKAQLTSGRPDVAFFRLNKAITEMPALKLASGKPVPMKKLELFGIHTMSSNKYQVVKYDCEVRRHETIFPFDIVEAPDVATFFGCAPPGGTSGSPMFMPGSDEVQFINMAGDTLEAVAQSLEVPVDKLPIQDRHSFSQATNVRCLNYPGSTPIPCADTRSPDAFKRFDRYELAQMNGLRDRPFPQAASFNIQFQPHSYQMGEPMDRHFEVIHVPRCRVKDEKLSIVQFPIEEIKLEMDQWGRLIPRVRNSQIVQAKVVLTQDTKVKLEMVWPPNSGVYRNPQNDLRKKWGNTFGIDLPVCAR